MSSAQRPRSSRADHAPSRRSKRLRKDSTSELSIEELFPDDIGYEADIEAVQPDTYEEPESDVERPFTPRRKFFSIDEDLAARMKHLGRDGSGTESPQSPLTDRGHKRRSLHEEVMQTRKGGTSDLEVTEVLDRTRSDPSPPRKRRRRSRLDSINSNHCQSEAAASDEKPIRAKVADKQAEQQASDAMDMT